VFGACRTYLEEQLRIKKGVDEDLEDDLTDLQAIMGLGKKEATDVVSEVTSKAYRSSLPSRDPSHPPLSESLLASAALSVVRF